MDTRLECFETDSGEHVVPIVPLTQSSLGDWIERAEPRERNWVDASNFEAKPGSHCLVPDADGAPSCVLAGVDDEPDCFELGHLAGALPPGRYRLADDWPHPRREQALLGFALGAYQFSRYKEDGEQERACLCLEERDERARIECIAESVYLCRDLINTPANDLLPDGLEAAAREIATEFGADIRCITGDELLSEGYPAIHAVGRASACPPRLIDITFGDPAQPRITLVGKGVCFDSGGLDIKPASGMRMMKKDMGGAAQALGLARAIMGLALPIRLRVLICAVENAIAGNAMRPGDVLPTRKGSFIEIDNTDAEGRVILCDALAEATSEKPQLLVDFATLTGAARVAVGTEISALFCNDDTLAERISSAGARVSDPVWRLPLHAGYRKMIESKVALLSNSGATPYAGAITAALFLEHFVDDDVPWAHFDIMAWNVNTRPGRPEGGEAMAMRAILEHLESTYGA